MDDDLHPLAELILTQDLLLEGFIRIIGNESHAARIHDIVDDRVLAVEDVQACICPSRRHQDAKHYEQTVVLRNMTIASKKPARRGRAHRRSLKLQLIFELANRKQCIGTGDRVARLEFTGSLVCFDKAARGNDHHCVESIMVAPHIREQGRTIRYIW